MPVDDDGVEIDEREADRIGRILSSLDDSDIDLLEPPRSLWEGIDASVARSAPGGPLSNGMLVEYRIDADDVVTEVGRSWADFARANSAPELVSPDPARTLWSYMGEGEIRELWQLLVQRVRTLQAPAQVPLRCDGPHSRRWFEITISPGPRGEVSFRSALVFEQTREEVGLLDRATLRDPGAQPIALCSWCGRAEDDDGWHDIERLVAAARLLERDALPPLSYGICGACREAMSAELVLPGSVRGEDHGSS